MKLLSHQNGLRVSLIVFALFIGCDNDENVKPLTEVRMDTFWEISAPADQQMDDAVLEDLRAKVRDMPNVYSLLIVRNGKIVHEQYHNSATMNSLLPTRSITKRITALMVGIGIEEGYIEGYPELITNFFPEVASAGGAGWDKVNIYQLLHMVSGMNWDEEDDLADYEKHLDKPLPYIFDRDIVHEPETYFAYNTPSIDLLSYVVERAYSERMEKVTEEKIFTPLGILGYEWESIDNVDIKRGGTGLDLTARDLAKIGLLHANYGSFQGHSIVKPGWISFCFDDVLSLDGVDGNHAAGLSIGNTWWTKEYSGIKTHYADGYGGQMLMIIPEHDIIIVMNRKYNVGANENADAFDEYFKVVLPDVLNSVLD